MSGAGYCSICEQHYPFVVALHGDKGGPPVCLICAGKWNAEHGKKRRLGRIVIRSMKAFMDGGGRAADLDKLKNSALIGGWSDDPWCDPLGYLHGVAKTADEVIELTSALLADAIRLAHPDCHPPERKELAHRTTQGLLALQPFVFPAPVPKPPPVPTPGASRSDSAVAEVAKKSPRYPCPECASTVPFFYCDPCKAEWTKIEEKRRAAERVQRRNQRQRRRKFLASMQPARLCANCGAKLESKRLDARFCSDTCRQKVHRLPVTAKASIRAAPPIKRDKHKPRYRVDIRDGWLWLGDKRIREMSGLRVEDGRLRFVREWDGKVNYYEPGHSNWISGEKYLRMCSKCQALFAGPHSAWYCGDCVTAKRSDARAAPKSRDMAEAAP